MSTTGRLLTNVGMQKKKKDLLILGVYLELILTQTRTNILKDDECHKTTTSRFKHWAKALGLSVCNKGHKR